MRGQIVDWEGRRDRWERKKRNGKEYKYVYPSTDKYRMNERKEEVWMGGRLGRKN